MYTPYFGFSRLPFENNHDREFLFLSDGHKEVLASLLYFIKGKKAFAMVCGDVGTGKTMLMRCFLQRLPKNVRPIVISHPFVNSEDLLAYLGEALNLPGRQERILNLSDRVQKALVEARSRSEQVVLIVDEAHLLSEQSLEEIRVLSNLETQNQNLLQILLVGQYELSHKLSLPVMRALRQRININRVLAPLSPAETTRYVDHRLARTGASFDACFDPGCAVLLHRMSGGVPRRINQLCDNALLICMSEKQKRVSRKILQRAEEALKVDVNLIPKAPRPAWQRVLKPALALVTVAGIFTLGGVSGVHRIVSYEGSRGPHLVVHGKINHGGVENASTSQPQQVIVNRPKAETPHPVEYVATESKENLVYPDLRSKLPRPSSERAQTDLNEPATQQSSLGNLPVTLPVRVVVKRGESLGTLASRHYPDNCQMGLLAILLTNRGIKGDKIYPGQVLQLPKLKLTGKMIQIDDNRFYAQYRSYQSLASLSSNTSWLKKKQVRFLVISSRDSRGRIFHRVVVGDYGREAELQEALLKTKTKSKAS
jgi:type II secretory pathway predicted ATPase ExeA